MKPHDKRERDKDRHFVTALARGLQILRCFSHDRLELTPGEIVRMTGLPQPTVWRLCHTLNEAGFIVCPGDGSKMALGVPALTLGYAALARLKLPQIALPYMQALTERHRVGVSLAVRDGLEMVYLQRTHGDFEYFNDPVGTRRPLVSAPTGWACIAAYAAPELTEVLGALRQQQGAAWESSEGNIHRAFDEYRQHGYVLSLGIMHDHLNALAVPICPVNGGTIHGLSVSGLAAVWPRERLVELAPELISLAHNLREIASPT